MTAPIKTIFLVEGGCIYSNIICENFGCKMTCQYIRRWPLRAVARLWCKVIHCVVCDERKWKSDPNLSLLLRGWHSLIFPWCAAPSALRSLKDAAPLSVSSQFYALTEERLLFSPIFCSLQHGRKAPLEIIILHIHRTGRIYFLSALERRGLCAMCFDGAARSFADEAMTLEIFIEKWTLFLRAGGWRCANKKKKDNLLGG